MNVRNLRQTIPIKVTGVTDSAYSHHHSTSFFAKNKSKKYNSLFFQKRCYIREYLNMRYVNEPTINAKKKIVKNAAKFLRSTQKISWCQDLLQLLNSVLVRCPILTLLILFRVLVFFGLLS